ncbi:hypothetical protein [Massilia eurypsychrophila]|nr:hypothetical protein [Massilia eurypsychrophila]
MGTHNAAGGHPGDASVGVGPENDSQGMPQQHDGSQRDSGGSGGAHMTRSLEDTNSDAPSPHAEDRDRDEAAEGAGTAATTTTRGPIDTHGQQGSAGKTGLGVPETGGNHEPSDMAPPSNP